MTKARCRHGAPWFSQCPWCEGEKLAVDYTHNQAQAVVVTRFAWWRNMTETDARAYLEQEVGALFSDLEIRASIAHQLRRAAFLATHDI